MMEIPVFSISQINDYIGKKIDSDAILQQIAVRGEISNHKVYPSGHHYFTLKDENSSLRCVMFRGNASRLRFRVENGMKVIATGKVSVYQRDGAYQLNCAGLTVDGVGDLYAAFEQLKKELCAAGLFESSHKKQLPRYPETIGIITSSAGAAVHDILRILNKRYPLASVKLLPVRVQGTEAPHEIASAIQYANKYRVADLLIVGRGGGSLEDLWAFNEKEVAFAIYESNIPIISAVGHEPDVTISDYVADIRAATPSNAAELAVPDSEALLQKLDAFSSIIANSLHRKIEMCQSRLSAAADSQAMQSLDGFLNIQMQTLENLSLRLTASENRTIQNARRQVGIFAGKIDAMSPLKVLSRGYGIPMDGRSRVIHSVHDTAPGEFFTLQLHDGKLTASITTITEENHSNVGEINL